MFYIWLGIVILLTIVEFLTVDLTTIWFVVSAIIALLLSLIINNFHLQFVVFIILGTILLVTTRPILLKLLIRNKEKANINQIVGMRGIVTGKIKRGLNGEVKVDGKRWTAYADKRIKVNTSVKILEINGIKLKVEEDND